MTSQLSKEITVLDIIETFKFKKKKPELGHL